MAKTIYSLKMELMLGGNETVFRLTAHELHGLQRLNQFVVLLHVQSWFTSTCAMDAPVNDM